MKGLWYFFLIICATCLSTNPTPPERLIQVSRNDSLKAFFGNTSANALLENKDTERCLAIWLLAMKNPKYISSKVTQKNGSISYACPILMCNKQYSSHNLVEKHVMCAHSSTRPYSCPIPGCLSRFTGYKGPNDHLNKFHRIRTASRKLPTKKLAMSTKIHKTTDSTGNTPKAPDSRCDLEYYYTHLVSNLSELADCTAYLLSTPAFAFFYETQDYSQ